VAKYSTIEELKTSNAAPHVENEKTAAAPAAGSNTAEKQTAAAEAPAVQNTATRPATSYNPAADASYQQAMSALETAKKEMPSYKNSYEAQLNDLYNQITGRDKFSYNVNEDALYQQYQDRYVNQGQMAMKDTMGQAAALTGGYGSSYGQSVGQQQYNAYLQQLNDVVPELYGMAYQQYQDQGDALKDQYSMMGQLADDEYGKYQDAMTQYYQQLNYLQGQADNIYNRGMEQAELAYGRQQDAYSNLVDMITTLGYKPTADELADAGMSDDQYAAYYKYYKKLNPTKKSSGGGGSGKGSGTGNGNTNLPNGANVATVVPDYSNFGVTGIETKVAELASKNKDTSEKKKDDLKTTMANALNNLNRWY